MYCATQQPIRILSRPKLNGPGSHWGVQLPDGWVTDRTTSGARVIPLHEFAHGQPVREVRRARPEEYRNVFLRLAESLAEPSSYRLLDNNCQHYANELIGEKPESPEVQVLGLLVVMGGLLYLAGNG